MISENCNYQTRARSMGKGKQTIRNPLKIHLYLDITVRWRVSEECACSRRNTTRDRQRLN